MLPQGISCISGLLRFILMHSERSNNDVILSHKTRLAHRRSSLVPHESKPGYETIGVSIMILIVDAAS